MATRVVRATVMGKNGIINALQRLSPVGSDQL